MVALAGIAWAAQHLDIAGLVGAALLLGHDVVRGEIACRMGRHLPAWAPVAVLGAVLGYCLGCCGAPLLGVATLVGAASHSVLLLLPLSLVGVAP